MHPDVSGGDGFQFQGKGCSIVSVGVFGEDELHLTGTVLVVGVGAVEDETVGVADLFAVRGEEYGFDFVGWPFGFNGFFLEE